MKIIIFIVVICTLFVVWSLCVVGASADEQLKRICDKEIRQMNYKVEKKIVCKETGEELKVGDEVSIQYASGGGNGCCRITKITDTGFHYSAGGTRRDKSVQLKDIVEIWKRKQNDEGAEK